MSDDDESDYMSDNFLVDGIKEDIRPGLVKSRTEKRQYKLAKKKEECDSLNKVKNKSIKVIEKEKLQLGLQNPITNSNKGYALLEKMGYTPGSSLGKCGAGLTEPIPVPTQRNFREGLGVRAALAEMREEKIQKRLEEKVGEPSINVFRARTREEVTEREARIDLYKSQKACHSLDSDEENKKKEQEREARLAKMKKEEKRKRKAERKKERLANFKLLMQNISEKEKDNSVDILNEGLALVPESYPTKFFTKEESDSFHKMLVEELSQDSAIQILTYEFLEEVGATYVRCSNISKKKLQAAVRRLSQKHQLNVVTRKRLISSLAKVRRSDYVCIGFLIPGQGTTKKKILKKLALQNPEFDVSNWIHTITVVKGNISLIKLEIPESDLKFLEEMGNSLCFGFYKLSIFLLDKETSTLNVFPPHIELDPKSNSLEGTFTPPEFSDSEADEDQITEWFDYMELSLPHLREETMGIEIKDKA